VPKTSAGLLLYRRRPSGVEVLLVHPGGPFWQRKDRGAWSIPKGEAAESEDLLAVAQREFREETGFSVAGATIALGAIRQSGAKIVHAWAVEADLDPSEIRSNTFEMEWPRGSGQVRAFPEVDRAAWFNLAEAHQRIHVGQRKILDALVAVLEAAPRKRPESACSSGLEWAIRKLRSRRPVDPAVRGSMRKVPACGARGARSCILRESFSSLAAAREAAHPARW
jgi:predicted NUDIX family NTP pyrophosphohydrolase